MSKRGRSTRHHLLIALLVTLATACGDSGTDNQGTGSDDGNNQAVAAAELFAAKGYAECHGAEGEGTDRPNSELVGTRLIIQQFTMRVRNGKGRAMPGFESDRITDEETRAQHAWLRAAR